MNIDNTIYIYKNNNMNVKLKLNSLYYKLFQVIIKNNNNYFKLLIII